MTLPDATHRRPESRLARLVTETMAPAIIVTALMLAVGLHAASHGAGLLWGLAGALFASFVPFAYIVRNVRAGRLTDHHVGLREQRRAPLLVGLGSVIIGAVLLRVLDAPTEITATVIAGAAGFTVALLVSHWWKVSVHSAVAAGSVVILALVYGPGLLLATPLVAVIAWSRVRLGDHTIAQVIVGAVVGAVVAYLGFTLAR